MRRVPSLKPIPQSLRLAGAGLALAWLLAACTTPPQAPAGVAAASAVASTPASEEVESEAKNANLPRMDLSDDLLLRFLVGEIALQRGKGQFSAQTWSDLAKRTQDPRVAKRATEVAIGTGQLALAREDAQIWIDAEPDSRPAKQVMLGLLLRANRLDEALPFLQNILRDQPGEAAAFFAQLHQLWDKSTDRAAALRLTEELIAPYPKLPEARFAHAIALANVGRVDDALKELDAAEQLRPDWDIPVLYHAQLLPEDQRLAYLQDAQKRYPKLVSLQLSTAKELVTAKRYDEALKLYDSVLKLQPQNLEALVGSGLVALQLRDTASAEKRLGDAIRLAPGQTANLRFYMGQIAEEKRHTDEALRWYESVEGELKPTADQRRVRLLARSGQVEEALALLQAKPADTNDSRIERIQLEAQVWREAKQYPQALQVLDDGLKTYPDSADLLYDRSLVADLAGNDAEAERDLRRYLVLQPDSVQGLNALGYTLANRNRSLDEADQLLEKAIAKEPDSPVIIDSVGWLRFRQGKLKEARELLAKAYGQLNDPEIAGHYIEVLWVDGAKSEARKVYDAALLGDPASEVLQELNKRLGVR
ncbi:Beta-barrel assembly-enhancing protease [Andreprevotia sp. IGB-42]|uniref:tetratricopeptide repeat protein n=1 Tax=Andreprevotia sp. IGB-42 TaxID=2497473 RepID=UPI001359E4BF|nr:tetratricopeptide repeat protein [Andreprevotia sp. IGB-42]KAF0814652.1 Beta-barrel assembly-enhancing protease [Andreprevotia sp. IGB-42]